MIVVHDPLKWTLAQKKDLQSYRPEHVISFHRQTRSSKPVIPRLSGQFTRTIW